MKKIIYTFGILFLSITIILNLIFTANLDSSEHIKITINNPIYIIGLIVLGALLYIANNFINIKTCDIQKRKIIKRIVYFIIIVSYTIMNIAWCKISNPPLVGDQVHIYNIAQVFYNKNNTELLSHVTYAKIPLIEYMQAYPQQITLSFIISIIFRIFNSDKIIILKILNSISNTFIIIALLKINNQLEKKYETNKILTLFLIATFVSLPMLATFIYGDILSIALCLFSVYFIMRYKETKKIRYAIIASILSMIAVMVRMNSLIFVIATVIYLVLNLINEFNNLKIKEKIFKTLIILAYIVISIFPSSIVKQYYTNKYNLDKSKTYPSTSFLLMAMEESPRGNGWYNESIGEPALKDPKNKKTEYIEKIKERLKYLTKHIGYTLNFYTMKITSMWTENTYSAIRNNIVGKSNSLEELIKPLTFYQKTLLLITCICSLIILIQNRKNISLDIIFLLTIFIGGFAFHILWEAKSRYIIPYVITLIPVASININKKVKQE